MEIFNKLKTLAKRYLTREHIIVIIISMFLVAGLLIGMILLIFSGGEVVEVPALVGLDTLSALEELNPTGLALRIEGQLYNNKYEKGLILSQDPEPHAKVRKNRDIRVVISRGTELIKMPNLTGLSTREAKVILQQAGLMKGDESEVNSTRLPYLRVLAQNPEPNSLVKRGMKINLLISLGPKKKMYLMPDCIGKKLTFVEKVLNDAGLTINEVDYEYTLEFPEGTIIFQNPTFATPIEYGEKVKFKVTKKDIVKDKNKLTRYVLLYYIPPISLLNNNIKIVLENSEDSSKEVIFSKIDASPGKKIELAIAITGNSIIKIYSNEIFVDEKKLIYKK